MQATYNQHIGVFENILRNDWCDSVVSIYEENIDKSKTRQETEDTLTIHKQDSHLGMRYPEEIVIDFYKKLEECLHDYNKKYNCIPEGLNGHFLDFKVQKTLPTEGYHIWHNENSGERVSDRFAVWTAYLNDVEEGGETEFLHQSYRLKAKKGTVCIFPAGYTHLHRGNPPLSGAKYIVTGWFGWTSLEQALQKRNMLKESSR